MDLSDITKYSQIIFYSVISVIAILTYLSVKRGFLNTVHTEYQKRVIDRLAEVSKEIGSEFLSTSESHWSNDNPIKEMVSKVNKVYEFQKDYIDEIGEYPFGVIVTSREIRMRAIIEELTIDIFLPNDIREKIISFLNNRLKVMSEIYFEEIEKYSSSLVSGKRMYSLDGEDNEFDEFHNNILRKLDERGCGIDGVNKGVNEIRKYIQSYLESFNPI